MKKFLNLKNKLMAVALILCGLITSCTKMIEIPASPPNLISQTDLFTDSASVLSALAGVYYNGYQASNGFALRNANLAMQTGTSADELALTTNTYDASTPALYANTQISNNGSISTLWTEHYSSIYQVNNCLEAVPGGTSISETFKKQLTGELKVVRAYYYFNLVNLWGGVPIVTTTDYKINGTLTRSTTDEVYAQIIADLTDAQTKLKANYPSAGHVRPNLYTATALLAKVYLYKGQWQNAYDAADQVIRSGAYSLVTDLARVFLDGSAEAIWQLPSNGSYYATGDAVKFTVTSGLTPVFPVSSFLLNAFEAGDQRKVKWIGTSLAGTTMYTFPAKYKNATTAANTPAEDLVVLRLGELYLIRAEAAARLNNTDGAIADLNLIRGRAGLGPTAAVSQIDVLNAIMHERQIELCFEGGNRWFDLKRWGTAVTVLSAEKPGWQSATPLVYPIPYSELRYDPFLVQTPGYQ